MLPASSPVTAPVDPTDAIVPSATLQVPPVVASDRPMPVPAHTDGVPVITAGEALTVTVAAAEQPVFCVKYIFVTDAATPYTAPVEPTVAPPILLLVHVPLPELDSTVVEPVQTFNAPVIGDGNAFTVNCAVLVQPAPVVYDMVVLPAAIPVTMPDDVPIVPAAAFTLLHTPPDILPVSVVVAPGHMLSEPVIFGCAFMVTIVVVIQAAPDENVIVALPAVTPVTLPEPSTVTLPLLLLHVPVPVLLSTLTEPTHTGLLPVIPDGTPFTVTTTPLLQPEVSAYDMVEVPGVTPVNSPEVRPIVAAPPVLVHVPPVIVLPSVIDPPEHSIGVPVIDDCGLTVTVVVR